MHLPSKSNILYDHRRANRGENVMRVFKKISTKIKITQPPVVRSALKPSQGALICTGSDGVSEGSRKIL